MKKQLFLAAVLGTIALNVQAFTLSNKAPSDGHKILVGQGKDGLAKGCHLEEGEFTVCNLGEVVFNNNTIYHAPTCEPYGPNNPANTCIGSDEFTFQLLTNRKNNKHYENVDCMLDYNNQKDLECYIPSGKKVKVFKIKSADQKNWIFNAIRSKINDDRADYWVED